MRKNGLFAVLFMLFAIAFIDAEIVCAAEDLGESDAVSFYSSVIADDEDGQNAVVSGYASGYTPAIAIEENLDAVLETEEVDVYDYESLEEIMESSVSLNSSSSDEEARRAWLKETMEEALLTFTDELDVSGYNITEEDLAIVAVNVVNADYRFCYVDSAFSYSYNRYTGLVVKVYFSYTVEEEEAIQMLAELEAAIDEAVSYADSSWSDMEKVLFINDYLCRTCEYDTARSGEDHTAYGALVEHCTVCEGYAKAFYAIGERLGLTCGAVVSTNLGHEWSYVQVGDSFYYVDVTWDDPTTDRLGQAKHIYFLKSYSYFCSDGGHTTDDWIYSGFEEDLSEADFADTSYDDYFWDDVDLGFEYIDGYWYTILDRNLNAYVCDGTSFEYEETVLTIIDKWYAWGSSTSYYTSGYPGIASYNGLLYYSTPTVVWACDVSALKSDSDAGEDTDGASADGTGSVTEESSGTDAAADNADSGTDGNSDGDTTDDADTDTRVTTWEVYTLSDTYAAKGYIYGIRTMLDGSLDIRLATGSGATKTVGNYTVLELGTEDKKEIADCTITVDDSSAVYDGTQILPEVVITDGTYTLVEGQDYVVVSLNNISPGEKTLYVAGMGSYTGTVEESFTISKKSQTVEATADKTSIAYGDSVTITATADGAGAISYSSSDTSVATVSGSGETATVTAVGTGTAVITITAGETEYYNSATTTVTFTVNKASQTVTASAGSTSIVYGNTTTITANTTGDGALSYSSGNASVATVSSSGKVTAKGAGTATITVIASATNHYKAAMATVTITVTRALQTLTVSSSSVSLAAGNTSTPTVSGAKTSLSYSSSNTSVATVSSSGKITAKAVGTATITVTAAQTACYNKATKTIKVTVKPVATTISSVQNTSSGVKITWTKVSGATGYYIYRATSASGTYTKIATVKSGSTVTYTNTTTGTYKVSSGKTYYYKVSAYASTGTAAKSSAKSIRYLTAGKISSLTNVSSGITIKWSKVTGASGYYIYRKASGESSYTKVATISSASTVSYTNKTSGTYKVVNGTTYAYYVIPYYKNSSGTVTKGTYAAAKKTVRLTAVSISSVKNSASKKMTVKWGKNTKATGYQIQYSTSSSFTSGSKTKSVTVSKAASVSKTISSLTKGKTYYVRVRAYKETSDGTKYYSAWSSKKSVKISK